MNKIIPVGFLPNDNEWSCVLHPYGCKNALVLEGDNSHGIGMNLWMCLVDGSYLAVYQIKSDGSDGCCVCFVAREVAASGNAARLNGAVVCVMDVFTSDHENRAIRRLFHHNRGYTYGRIVMDH